MTLLREIRAIETKLLELESNRPHWKSPKYLAWDQERKNLSSEVLQALSNFERYQNSENLVVTKGNGGISIKPDFFLPHLLDVVATHGASFAVSALRKLLRAKSAKVTTNCLVWGVATEHRVRLAPSVYLSPLPDNLMPEVLNGEYSQVPFHLRQPSSFSVLSSSLTVAPVVIEASEVVSDQNDAVSPSDRLRDVAAILCSLGPSPIVLEQTWNEFTSSKLAAIDHRFGRSIAAQEVLPLLPSAPFRPDGEAKRHVARFLRLPSDLRVSLRGPLDRLNSGMRRRSPLDQALDCGIALEMLLQQESESNTEITYRLALRAGLLLGRTLDERREFRTQVKSLYKLRSIAAHGSTTTPSNGQATAQAGFSVCAAVIRKIVQRGGFPRWEDLELGSRFRGNDK